MINQDDLKNVIDYCRDSGIFTWKNNIHGRCAGMAAGYVCPDGYIVIMINGKNYPAHRLAFLYVNGAMPSHQVDHINHDREDNRWINLREAIHKENGRNASLSSLNTSGVCGVSWFKHMKKWRSYITVDQKQISLGLYGCFFDAVCARKSAEVRYGFHENHGADTGLRYRVRPRKRHRN